MTKTMTRQLGRSGIEVSALGLGCWAIGGPFTMFGTPDGWGQVDDAESIRAIHAALDIGVTFFDTADAYGAGHSEEVLGQALADRRDRAVIATKFGFTHDADRRDLTGTDTSPAYVRRALTESLRRLRTDHADLYQLHVGEMSDDEAYGIRAVLEELVAEGSIRAYGWSTSSVTAAKLFVDSPHYVSVQHQLNVFSDDAAMLALCDEHDLTSINLSPLAKGLLTGKFTASSQLPADDVRTQNYDWLPFFTDGRPDPDALARLDAIRDILRSDGRTMTQGALAWIWGRSDRTVPIPGFKGIAQATENAEALRFGPLTPVQMKEIDALLSPSAD